MIRIDAHLPYASFAEVDNQQGYKEQKSFEEHLLSQDIESQSAASIYGYIAVESTQTEEGNVSLLNFANQNTFIKGIIGWIDPTADNVIEKLSYYSTHPRFAGIHYSVDEKNLKEISKPTFSEVLSFLTDHNLTIDLNTTPQFLRTIKELAEAFPHQKFILNYLGNPLIKEGILIPWADDIFMLAEYPNLYCKLMGTLDINSFSYKNLEPFFSVVLHAFGCNRIMFGSDWRHTEKEYSAILEIIEKALEPFSEEEKRKIWLENATRIYGLKA